MTVLVAYATTGGSTGEIAGWVAEELRTAGLDTRLLAAAAVDDVAGYEALILGASMYAGGWHADARQFANRFAGCFTGRPVWLFSSGPLDHTADDADLPPNHQAEVAMRLLQARKHETFGGRLTPEAHGWLGFIARRIEHEGHAGDFRNPQRIRAWARGIATEITSAGGQK